MPQVEPPSDCRPRGRYAPSPTGLLHVGNARTALAAWLSIRARGGAFLWRIEDLDPPRVVEGAADAALQDLRWLGLDWDEGPDVGGPYAPYRQSERGSMYDAALDALHKAGRLFPCALSRRELSSMASAPHGEQDDEAPYPVSARPTSLAPDWYDRLRRAEQSDAALRFRSETTSFHFVDGVHGALEQRSGGDFVLRRRDGLYAYQLAVVVDDWKMGVTEVVRGDDLLSSTSRQLELCEGLGVPHPAYAHVPMVLDHRGDKLSKRDTGLTLRSLREAGVRPEQLVGSMAYSFGLLDHPRATSARGLVAGFDLGRIQVADWQLSEDFPRQVLAVR